MMSRRRTLTTKTMYRSCEGGERTLITKTKYRGLCDEPYYSRHHAPGRHVRRIWLLRAGLMETPWGTVYVGRGNERAGMMRKTTATA